MKTLRERFEEKVERIAGVDCHIWIAGLRSAGYGGFLLSGKNMAASRVAYQLYVGPIPDGMFVCHRCDVRCCVNPDHLFLGTNADNVADMLSKGRGRHVPVLGEAHGKARLKEEHVRVIREACAVGVEQRWIAQFFGVSQVAISDIARGKRWRHLK